MLIFSPPVKPVYPEENSCLTNIHTQTILDAIFESDDEEDVQVSKRRRMLSGSDSEESDEDDGPKYPDAGELIFQTKSVFIY